MTKYICTINSMYYIHIDKFMRACPLPHLQYAHILSQKTKLNVMGFPAHSLVFIYEQVLAILPLLKAGRRS